MAFSEWQSRALTQGASLALVSNGTTLVDGSPNAHALTAYNDPEVTASGMEFDGLIQYATVPGHADLVPTAAFTWETLARPEKTSVQISTVGGWMWYYAVDAHNAFQAYINEQDHASEILSLRVAARVSGTTYSAATANGTVTRGKIYHFGATLDSGTITAYINGVAAGTGTAGGGAFNTSTLGLTVGSARQPSQFFRGGIYTVGFDNDNAVDAAEMLARYKLLNPAAIGHKPIIAAQQAVQR
jgi:hypothetical protein